LLRKGEDRRGRFGFGRRDALKIGKDYFGIDDGGIEAG